MGNKQYAKRWSSSSIAPKPTQDDLTMDAESCANLMTNKGYSRRHLVSYIEYLRNCNKYSKPRGTIDELDAIITATKKDILNDFVIRNDVDLLRANAEFLTCLVHFDANYHDYIRERMISPDDVRLWQSYNNFKSNASAAIAASASVPNCNDVNDINVRIGVITDEGEEKTLY